MKKTVGVLSLIVMLLSQVFSPFVYAVSGEEVPVDEVVVEEPAIPAEDTANEVDAPIGGAETVETSQQEPETSVDDLVVVNSGDQNGTDLNTQNGSGNIEDAHDLAVVVETGVIVEDMSGYSAELSGGKENLEGIGTGEESNSGIMETIKNFLGLGESKEEEKEQKNYEYESQVITGEAEYEGVKVEVYAATGLFASGTLLTIEAVTGIMIENVKEVLLSGNVEMPKEEEQTVVAFDITFRDPKTLEEVQPKDGAVQVVFNYEDNKELIEAEESEEQEVKIYHLNDINEEGKKIEELTGTKVEEVVVNEHESEENNTLVIEAETFSIYAIIKGASNLGDTINITYYANGGKFKSGDNQLDSIMVSYTKNSNGYYYPNINLQAPDKQGYMFAGWYTTSTNQNIERYGQIDDTTTSEKSVYAKWLYFSDYSITLSGVTFTMMDRNLGAESNSQDYNSSYGYYYQWGNNYGFKLGSNTINERKAIENINHELSPRGPGNYYSNSIYRNIGNWSTNRDVENNENLWGGIHTINSDIDKQGPCPEGYHVPDRYEWDYVYNLFLSEYENNANYCSSYSRVGYCIRGKLKLPLAGSYSYSNSTNINTARGFYRTSTPAPRDIRGTRSYSFGYHNNLINENDVGPSRRGNAYPVRCFKNSRIEDMNQLIYSGDNGTEDIVYNMRWWEPITNEHKPSDPQKQGYEFLGRYLYENGEYGKLFDYKKNVRIDKTMVLKARWGEKNQIYTYDANGGLFENGLESINIEHHAEDGYYLRNINLQIPNRTGYMFAGRYTTSGDGNYKNQTEEWIGQTNGTIAQITKTVYAKWMPFNDLSLSISGLNLTIMDRNLGAENVAEGVYENDTSDSRGFYYQWGNNYGFKNVGDLEYYSENLKDITGYGPGNYYYNHNFIKVEPSPYLEVPIGRTIGDNINLRGGKSIKSPDNDRQGPCPQGYHIPNKLEWQRLNVLFQDYEDCDGKLIGNCLTSKLKLPYAGYRSSMGEINTDSSNVTSRSSSLEIRSDNRTDLAYHENINKYFLSMSDEYISRGHTIRCFKNSKIEDTNPLIFSGDNGTEDIVYNMRWWEPITEDYIPIPPTKENYGFLGWYVYENGQYLDLYDFTQEQILKKPLVLKAKRGRQNQVYKYNTNGGSFKDNSNEKIIHHRIVNGSYIAIENIDTPNRTGYMFAGWSINSGNDINEIMIWEGEWDKALEENEVLYAKWLPFNDLILSLSGEVFTIMDRNLGAIAYMNQENKSSREWNGYYYQWGNNYGFNNYSTIKNIDEIRIDGDIYDGKDYYYSSVFKGIKNFPYRWTIENNDNLRGGGDITKGDEDKQGPCPVGYHVPSQNERKSIYNYFESQKKSDISYCDGFSYDNDCFSAKLKLPFAGYRYYQNAQLNTYGGTYRSSTPYSDDDAYYMYFSNNSNYTSFSDTDRVYGYSVRCFKNSKKIEYHSNGGIIPDYPTNIKKGRETPMKLLNSFRIGYGFSGWYLTENYEQGTEVNDNNIIVNDDVIHLFAKWNKYPRYTFYANGGIFDDKKIRNEIRYTYYYEDRNIVENQGWYTKTYTFGPISGLNEFNVAIKSVQYPNYITISAYSGNYTNNPIYTSDGTYPSSFKVKGNMVIIEVKSNGPPLNIDISLEGIIGGDIKQPYRTGYIFTGRYETGDLGPFDPTLTEITKDRLLYAKWEPINYIIQFNTNEGVGVVNDLKATYGEEINLPTITREGYVFKGWKSEDGIIYINSIPEGTGITTEDGLTVILTAQWEKIKTSQGLGRSIQRNKNIEDQEHNVADENEEIEKKEDKQETKEETKENNENKTQETTKGATNTAANLEIQSAYEWAYSQDVTTIPTLEEAMPDGVVKRGHLAKMVVNYAVNVLGREIPEKIPSECRWNDGRKDWESEEIKDYAVKSCALGLMGLDMPKFLPNLDVTRAQFGTIMSRLLWGKKYAGGTPYYRKHLNALKENNIMTQIENPERRVELRQWVWLMLMRSAENK